MSPWRVPHHQYDFAAPEAAGGEQQHALGLEGRGELQGLAEIMTVDIGDELRVTDEVGDVLPLVGIAQVQQSGGHRIPPVETVVGVEQQHAVIQGRGDLADAQSQARVVFLRLLDAAFQAIEVIGDVSPDAAGLRRQGVVVGGEPGVEAVDAVEGEGHIGGTAHQQGGEGIAVE